MLTILFENESGNKAKKYISPGAVSVEVPVDKVTLQFPVDLVVRTLFVSPSVSSKVFLSIDD